MGVRIAGGRVVDVDDAERVAVEQTLVDRGVPVAEHHSPSAAASSIPPAIRRTASAIADAWSGAAKAIHAASSAAAPARAAGLRSGSPSTFIS
jgi:hypothetical protein